MAESTAIVEDFSTHLSEMDRSSRQRISKDIVERNNIISQLDIVDIFIPLPLLQGDRMLGHATDGPPRAVDSDLHVGRGPVGHFLLGPGIQSRDPDSVVSRSPEKLEVV